MDNLNNHVLVFFCHLVIARQTQPAPENISSHVDAGALYVGIGPAAAVSFNRHERIRPIERLHMHGLP